jgi:glycine/D-amino acid oxidase-like deaminating enzyme
VNLLLWVVPMGKRENTTTFDVVIVGGGIIGSSIAYHLANDGFNGRIAVFEKDPTYEFSSTTLSAGGVREQFSTEVNIRISQYSIEFYEKFDEVMTVDGEKAHADFRQRGYLFWR